MSEAELPFGMTSTSVLSNNKLSLIKKKSVVHGLLNKNFLDSKMILNEEEEDDFTPDKAISMLANFSLADQ